MLLVFNLCHWPFLPCPPLWKPLKPFSRNLVDFSVSIYRKHPQVGGRTRETNPPQHSTLGFPSISMPFSKHKFDVPSSLSRFCSNLGLFNDTDVQKELVSCLKRATMYAVLTICKGYGTVMLHPSIQRMFIPSSKYFSAAHKVSSPYYIILTNSVM